MASLIFAEAFVEDMTQVVLKSKREEIMGSIALLEHAPSIGSTIIPASIRSAYGQSIRKLIVDPFDVVYEYREDEDTVHILGLIHQRAAR